MVSPSGIGHPVARRYIPLRFGVGVCAAGVLLVGGGVVGCSSEGSRATVVTAVPAPTTSTPEEDCRQLVGYWARAVIQNNRWSGLDWEQKGFSIDQHAIHERIVAAARDEQRAHGTGAALRLVDRRAREECTVRHGAMGGGRH
ncbi:MULTISPECIES: hypothetical protein [unclassified Streptomyces]|uniref:hypothetical protein n=1 Tax=unclassified Streptomyces TaxID=2593676 RepID=UPI003407B01B